MLTALDDEFYSGLILNHELNGDEATRAKKRLHVHGSVDQGNALLAACTVWFGVGGPVRLADDEVRALLSHAQER